jgi:hypothetical protein
MTDVTFSSLWTTPGICRSYPESVAANPESVAVNPESVAVQNIKSRFLSLNSTTCKSDVFPKNKIKTSIKKRARRP